MNEPIDYEPQRPRRRGRLTHSEIRLWVLFSIAFGVLGLILMRQLTSPSPLRPAPAPRTAPALPSAGR